MALELKREIMDDDAYMKAGPEEMSHCWLDKRLQMNLDIVIVITITNLKLNFLGGQIEALFIYCLLVIGLSMKEMIRKLVFFFLFFILL